GYAHGRGGKPGDGSVPAPEQPGALPWACAPLRRVRGLFPAVGAAQGSLFGGGGATGYDPAAYLFTWGLRGRGLGHRCSGGGRPDMEAGRGAHPREVEPARAGGEYRIYRVGPAAYFYGGGLAATAARSLHHARERRAAR